ncbi:unnamed protein product [Nyctereutes procyonoides]|uniref:(raccoon dog) hypothetical protein n=1 Tax=Nyctereutes procyonoides TaxID=34880 RepID=A0A811ZQC1_NYCPR|nr:unnamed protein product [Nyctereutes procyonoides]
MGRTVNRYVSVQLRMKSVTQSQGDVPVCPAAMETAVISGSNFILKLEEKGRKKKPLFGFETQVCPKDHYGQDCVQQCSCGSGQCDLVTGGPNCELKCTCKNGGPCSPVDGSSTCGLGWTGNYCEKHVGIAFIFIFSLPGCRSGQFGPDGAPKCHCIHRAHCTPCDGSCTCPWKRMGPTCEENDLDNPEQPNTAFQWVNRISPGFTHGSSS